MRTSLMGESVPPGVSFDSLKLLLDPAQGASRSPRLLASSVVDLSSTLSQTDSVTLSTDLFSEKGRLVTPPGRYKLTITATTISGDHSQLTVPIAVKGD